MKINTTVNFEVTGWEPKIYDESIESAKLSRVTIKKKFSGELEGDSIAEGLFCQCGDGSASYIVLERVTGKMAINGEGRSGTFVIHHGGIMSGGAPMGQFGDVIPGSGTGGFAGIGGKVLFQHDESGAIIKMDLTFE